MVTNTAVLDKPTPMPVITRHPEPLLREALGEALRDYRAEAHVTLRELSLKANVSPGYLSELERGRKEVSSELLAAVCHALDVSVSDVLIEAAGSMALRDVAPELVAAGRAVLDHSGVEKL